MKFHWMDRGRLNNPQEIKNLANILDKYKIGTIKAQVSSLNKIKGYINNTVDQIVGVLQLLDILIELCAEKISKDEAALNYSSPPLAPGKYSIKVNAFGLSDMHPIEFVDDAGSFMDSSHKKDPIGAKLIQKLCKPHKDGFNEDPELMKQLFDYCED